MTPAPIIERLDAAGCEAALPALCRLLSDCVEAEAAVGFVQPFGHDASLAFWRETVLPAVRGRAGARHARRRRFGAGSVAACMAAAVPVRRPGTPAR